MGCDPFLGLKNKHILYLYALVFLKLHGILDSRGCWVMSLGCTSSPLELSPSVAVLHGDVHIRAVFSLCLSIVNLISGFFSAAYHFPSARRKKTATPPHIHPYKFTTGSCVKKKWQAAILNLKIFVKLSCNSFVERGHVLNINPFRQPKKGNRVLLVRRIKIIWTDNLMADYQVVSIFLTWIRD